MNTELQFIFGMMITLSDKSLAIDYHFTTTSSSNLKKYRISVCLIRQGVTPGFLWGENELNR